MTKQNNVGADIIEGLNEVLEHVKGNTPDGMEFTVHGKRLRAKYISGEDKLEIGLIVPLPNVDEPGETNVFKSLYAITDSFGEPIGLKIVDFKQDNWHRGMDTLKLAIIMHFDETESEAHTIVDKLFGTCKF